jgi:hypothetical protein
LGVELVAIPRALLGRSGKKSRDSRTCEHVRRLGDKIDIHRDGGARQDRLRQSHGDDGLIVRIVVGMNEADGVV